MKAYELLNTPGKWTKGAYAKAKNGNPIGPQTEGAACFCLMGALIRCYPDEPERSDVEDKLRNELFRMEDTRPMVEGFNGRFKSVPTFNDDPRTTYEDVIELLRKVDV